jgi:hypothetical protein
MRGSKILFSLSLSFSLFFADDKLWAYSTYEAAIHSMVKVTAGFKPDATYSSGSGVIVKMTKDSIYVLTCHHVVTHKNQSSNPYSNFEISFTTIEGEVNLVTTNTKLTRAQIIAKDSNSDLALLKVHVNFANLQENERPVTATLAQNSWHLVPYQSNLSSAGFSEGTDDASKFNGVYTQKLREITTSQDDGRQVYHQSEFIEIDTVLVPGASGGPTWDQSYDLIGINQSTSTVTQKSNVTSIGAIRLFLSKAFKGGIQKSPRQKTPKAPQSTPGLPPGLEPMPPDNFPVPQYPSEERNGEMITYVIQAKDTQYSLKKLCPLDFSDLPESIYAGGSLPISMNCFRRLQLR